MVAISFTARRQLISTFMEQTSNLILANASALSSLFLERFDSSDKLGLKSEREFMFLVLLLCSLTFLVNRKASVQVGHLASLTENLV